MTKLLMRSMFTIIILLSISNRAMASDGLKPKSANLPGVIAEHVKDLNTLALSFVDMSQPLYAIKLQILAEFLNHAKNPKLILLVTNDRDIQTLNALMTKQNSRFDLKRIQYVKAETTFLSSSWIRDFSPVMVQKKDGTFQLVSFDYDNGGNYSVDQKSLAKVYDLVAKKINLRIEGGNILSDELGRLYISTAAIENNLPQGFSPDQYKAQQIKMEKILKAALLPSEIVWIPRLNREYEGTGHVDMYIRFLKNQQAVVASSEEKAISSSLDEIAKIIISKGFKVTRIRANSKMVNHFRDQKIFPSYTNSILVNDTIFIAKFDVAEDRLATTTYEKMGYKVVQIDGESIHFGGSVHCLTYTYP